MKITGDIFRNFLKKNKACKIQSNIVLEAKLGMVEFDFSSLEKLSFLVGLSKISGNGKVLLGNKEVQVFSRNEQTFYVDPLDNLLISRPKDSVGEVSINYILVEEMVNWKRILEKCGPYKSIRVIGNRLHASEGGNILFGVKSIRTEPDNMYFFEGEKVVFLGSCEIKSIETDNAILAKKDPPFIHRDGPTPSEQSDVINNEIKTRAFITINQREPMINQDIPDVVYDSDSVNTFGKGNFFFAHKLLKLINSNGQDYLLIKRNGIFTLPIAELKQEKEYLISVTCKKLNGNGKLKVGFSFDNNYSNCQSVVTDSIFDEKIVTFKVPYNEDASVSPKLVIGMFEDGLGEVLVSKIVIIANIASVSKEKIINNYFGIPKISRSVILSTSKETDYVKTSTKESAVVLVKQYNAKNVFENNFIIEPLSYSGRVWVSKIINSLPGLKIKDSKKLLNGTSFTNKDADLTITSLGKIKARKNIFIEEWSNKQYPSKDELNILKNCETIISPSLFNIQILKQELPDKNIKLLPKLWPTCDVSDVKKEKSILYFEKNNKITNLLVKYWKPQFPKLYVVGSTCEVPTYVEKISEYVDYKEIVNKMFSCLSVLDISTNTNYNSSIVNFCINNNINIITNNLFEVMNDPNNVYFINTPVDNNDDINLDVAVLEAYFEQLSSKDISPSDNKYFIENFKNLVGAA